MHTNGSKERPIIFSGGMVRAILEGRKTQTRRIVKPQPPKWIDRYELSASPIHWLPSGVFLSDESGVLGKGKLSVRMNESPVRCPVGQVGDRLWVRETFSPACDEAGTTLKDEPPIYKADNPVFAEGGPEGWSWMVPIFMPRWASRLTLEITDIRIERLQEITVEDIVAEGVQPIAGKVYNGGGVYTEEWIDGWNALNAKRGYSWESNPWVWVISFRREQEA